MKEKNKSLPIHYKSTSCKFQAPTTTNRNVSGYFASFNTLDSDGDVILPGAFAKSIQERGPQSTSNRQIKYLHQHDICEIAGPLTALKEDEVGLYFEGSLEQTPLGDVILERYMNGTYREHSFGFQYVWDKCNFVDKPVTADGIGGTSATISVFECSELNLFEGSVVTFGANSNTPFTGFKGSTKADHIKQLDDELNFLIKHAPDYAYELRMRQLWSKQYSLATALADDLTKEALRAEAQKKQTLNLNYITNNLKIS